MVLWFVIKWPVVLVVSLSILLTFASIQQGDLKAFPARFLRVDDHSQFRLGSQEGRFHLLSMTPVHPSALAARKNQTNQQVEVMNMERAFM